MARKISTPKLFLIALLIGIPGCVLMEYGSPVMVDNGRFILFAGIFFLFVGFVRVLGPKSGHHHHKEKKAPRSPEESPYQPSKDVTSTRAFKIS